MTNNFSAPALTGTFRTVTSAQPAAFDYPAALALRRMAKDHGDMPLYLLGVEVTALLHYLPDLYQQTLVATLWNTGARINEALALTREDFHLDDHYPYVSLSTLKQRQEKAERGPGAPAKNAVTRRQVTLSDDLFLSRFNSMVATLRIPKERRNPATDRMEPVRIWGVTDRTVRTWLNDAVARAADDGVTFSIPVTPHTLRHSYAMHMLYSGVPLKVLQALMGHKSMKSTEVYTKIFALDVAARYRVQFSMPEADALAIIKHDQGR